MVPAMSVRALAIAVLLGGGVAPGSVARPAVGMNAAPDTRLAACRGRDGWSDAAPPTRIFANVYDVGSCGIVVLLITSDAGHILIDGATAQAAPHIAANIRALGLNLADVRIILNSHEHIDHAGGIAALKRLTGAKLYARAPAVRALETGLAGPGDPQAGLSARFSGAHVDRIVADGTVVRLGPLALSAHATPGHTAGSTSWTWRSCDGRTCHDIAYVDSLTAISAPAYRFTGHPAYLATFNTTLRRVAVLPCDLLITPHPGASGLYERLAGKAPLVDRAACTGYAAVARAGLDERLARERKNP